MIHLVDTPSNVTPIRPSLIEALKNLGPVTPTPAAPDAPAADLDDETPAPRAAVPSGWTKIVGPRLAQVVLNLSARLVVYTSDKSKKLEAGEVTDDTAEYCADSMALALAHWFPEAALTPTKQLMLAFSLAAGEQWIGREEIEVLPPAIEKLPTPAPAPAPIRATAAATAAPTPTPPPPDVVSYGAA